MTINGKSQDIKYDDLIECANSMNITKIKANLIIKEVLNAIYKWEEFAKEAEVFKEDMNLIKEMIQKQIKSHKIIM